MTTGTPAPDDDGAPLTLDSLRALLAEFADLPGDTPVILQKDGEGNDFSPLAGGDRAMYLADTAYSGEAYPTAEEVAADPQYTEEDEAPEEAVLAVVLYPVN
ncbi:hypothetical protein [Streptomyces sp. NBC_01207]|uniref:hypothetical protein n=1 Tax=Streptomyces sp. NBC_01207 TaxID=2903772 RepID=UPI002E110FE8|nr:hypothetical protein OG457_27630 [Streptomyces sp. NBC_01207]